MGGMNLRNRKRARIGGALVLGLALFAWAAGHRARERHVAPAAPTSPASPPAAVASTQAGQGFLYGRVTSEDGVAYEGRLRWGGDQEAFWGDYFNGSKSGNPWAAQVPRERLPREPHTIEIFGIVLARFLRPIDLDRFFMARFGDIARIEARGPRVRVTLKSGAAFDLNRFDASDFDDGVRVWDGRRGVVDLASGQIRAIELFATARLGAAPSRLHGTVHTRQGDFTGFLQWDRQECVGTDELRGHAAGGVRSLRFDTLRSIARVARDRLRVTLTDGREIVLSGTGEAGQGNHGIYVDDPRYGRVLVSWGAFERVDLDAGGSGPAYGDFPPGHPLTGRVITRGGGRLAGRLVYDLDESETTETLDAPSQGVDYTIPFARIASIVPAAGHGGHARVTLESGEELQLERAGDLGRRNAGLLIFTDGRKRPEYVRWADVERIDLGRPPVR